MKIYVAAKFEEKETVRTVYDRIRECGHTVAYDWTQHESIKPYAQNSKQAQGYAENELAHIRDCDVLIAILNKKGTTLLMEIGAAIMAAAIEGKQIYVVGERNKSSPWLFLPHVQKKDSLASVFQALDCA